MAWKNGGGETREIAIAPDHASLDDFDWRLSMARIAGDGPFSSFPGIERTLCILNGNGLALAFADGETARLTVRGGGIRFAADRPVTGRLLDGPVTDLNIMTRKALWRHEAFYLPRGSRFERGPADLCFLFCIEGEIQLGNGVTLQALDLAEIPAGTPARLDHGDAMLIRLHSSAKK